MSGASSDRARGRTSAAVRAEPASIGTSGARDPLAAEVRLLGALLGQVITEQAGTDLFELVERVRKRMIALRRNDDPLERERLADELAAVDLDRAESLAAGYMDQFRERRDAALTALRAQGFEVPTPRATMYLWIPLPEGVRSSAFQRRALEEAGVVTLAGSDFGPGGEGFFRVALTVATPRLVEAAERLGRVLAAV